MRMYPNELLKLIIAIIVSICLHGLLLTIFLNRPILKPVPTFKDEELKYIETADAKLLSSLKTVGIQDSMDNKFSEMLPKAQLSKPLDLRPNTLIDKTTLKTEEKADDQANAVVFNKNQPETVNIKKEVGKTYSLTPAEEKIIDGADFNIAFTPPKGVKYDELNPLEKKLYSFQRRSYQIYVQSFLRTYFRAKLQKPYLLQKLAAADLTLHGKIVFDSSGNIVSIKIINPTGDDDITNLFQQTLETIEALRNPPAEIIENGTFSGYYTLILER